MDQGGASVEAELWQIPEDQLGGFINAVPAPLCFGKVRLLDGSEAEGFLCEAAAAADALDITSYGGYRSYQI